MTLRYADSFDTYATADLGLHWSAWSSVPQGFGNNAVVECTATTFRSGSQSLHSYAAGANGSPGFFHQILDNQQTWILGVAIYAQNYPTAASLHVLDSTTEQIGLYNDSNGNLILKRGGTTIATASGLGRFRTNAWNYLELKVTVASSGGVAVARLNGQTILSFSGNTQASANAWANVVGMQTSGINGDNVYFDDLYICDGTGTVNKDFLGDVRVQPIFPAVAGLTQFTASGAASDVLCVKEHTQNGDTTFAYTASAGVADTYGMDQITGYTGGIPGIYVRAIARKDDAGTRIIAPIVVSVAATGIGPQDSLSNSYTSADGIFETDPNTGSLWTLAALNAAVIGVSAVQ